MTDLDLTDAVEAAARAWFERGQSGRMDAGRGGNIVRTKPITQRLKAKILERDGHACVNGQSPDTGRARDNSRATGRTVTREATC